MTLMKKLKILALIYSPEDKSKISKWLNLNSSHFEITAWSKELTVPIQAAIAHYCQTDEIDGIVIDDHFQYDSIVMNRVADCLRLKNLSLFSASIGASAVFAAPCKVQKLLHVSATTQSQSYVRAS